MTVPSSLRRFLTVALAAPLVAAGFFPAGADGEDASFVRETTIQCALGLRTSGCRGVAVEPDHGLRRLDLPAIQFEFDSDRLTPAAVEQARTLGAALASTSHRTFSIAVQGHTDSAGSAAYNRALSLRRAHAVTHFLTDETGVSGHRLIAVGLGESEPLAGLDPADAGNRRVELVNLGAAAPAPRERAAPPTRRALLVGIDDYRSVSPLRGPANDARAMAEFVVSGMGYAWSDVKLLLDGDATRAAILAALEEWLVEGTGPGDEAFLFFSGHGYQQPDDDGDEVDDRRDETLVPVDVSLNESGRLENMITDDELAALLRRMADRRVAVVIDSCHSGTSTRGADWRWAKTPRLRDGTAIPVGVGATRGVSREAEALVSPAERGLGRIADLTVWTAVRADQKALVDREAEAGEAGSVFTRRLLWGARDGSADADADGAVTADELLRYLRRESAAYCERHRGDCSGGLTPQIEAASWRRDESAFGASAAPLPPNATLAKDILVRHAPKEESGTADNRTVRLRIEAGTSLTLGDEVEIVVESDHEGALVVLDISASGDLTQIFPNDESLRSGLPERIGAGSSIALPGENAGFRFRAVPPVGRGMLVAVVAEENAPLRELASRHKDLSVVPRPGAYLVELAEALRHPGDSAEALEDLETRAESWRAAALTYRIAAP